jgi:hypothetical protein
MSDANAAPAPPNGSSATDSLMSLVIMAGSRLRSDSANHMKRLKTAQASIILSAAPVAKSLAASAITTLNAAVKEK